MAFPNIGILDFGFSKHCNSGVSLFQTLEFWTLAFPNIVILNNKLLIQALKFWILFIRNWQLYIKDHLNATKSASSTLIMNGSIIMECGMGGGPIHMVQS